MRIEEVVQEIRGQEGGLYCEFCRISFNVLYARVNDRKNIRGFPSEMIFTMCKYHREKIIPVFRKEGYDVELYNQKGELVNE